MNFWTLDRVAAALEPLVTGARPAGSKWLGRVSTDTRTIERGGVFVALIGERYDGHDFVAEAVRRGAAALVLSRELAGAGSGMPVFLVPDTTEALGALGRYRRRVWGGTVVAIAGSNGKTSTKELVAAALSTRFHVHATRGNLNNQVGVPLTLLAIPDAASIAVVEVGTNHPGEVALLRSIVEPDISVVTSIGEEHLEGLGDLAGVLREESAIFGASALAVVPAAQPEVGVAARALAGRVVEAGIRSDETSHDRPSGSAETGAGHDGPTGLESRVLADAWGLDAEGRGWFEVGSVRVSLPLLGAHNVRNALLAMAVARACGVDDESAGEGMAAMPPLAMRSALEPLGRLLLLNDAYNANPASSREALALLDAVGGDRPRVAVLGSMLELGGASPALHEEIARRALASRATLVAGVGEFSPVLARLAPDDPRVVTAADADTLWPLLAPRLPPDAVVLLKGSRGTRLERLVPHLRAFAGVPEAAATPAH